MKMKVLLALIVSSALTAPAMAAVSLNEKAPQGGNFVYNLGGEPPTIHPITSSDLYASKVQALTCDTLAVRDADTYEWKPRLAEKWEISKDNKVFTFFLRKNAVFHDGTPVTAEDVKFSFDAVRDPKYEAAHLIPYIESLTKIEVIDTHTIRFTARDTYFGNFAAAVNLLAVIPKATYSDVEKSKKMNRTIICSGPYKVQKFDRGQVLVLKKFDKWWGNEAPEWKGAYNFDTITMRFYKDENVAIERAKKGELDFLEFRVEAFMKKTEGAPWGKSVFKHKVANNEPKPYGFVGFNFKNELFKDKSVRLALSHLFNREEMNKKFRYGMSDLAIGPIYIRSEYAPKMKAIDFNPKKAQELLSKAGWKDADKNGVLEKTINGKSTELKFTLMYPNKDTEKYWTMFREDLKKAGVDMELKYLEWNSFIKILDEGNFDAVTLSWGGGSVDPDPKQIWHSSSATAGGSNFISYKNSEVDKLIDEARLEPSKPKRVKLLKEVYKKIAEDGPYIFLFNDKYFFYGNSSRMGMPAETFGFEVGTDYWWMKP